MSLRVCVNTYSWFPKSGQLMWQTELKGLARGVSRALGQTISTSTCCIGQTGLPTRSGVVAAFENLRSTGKIRAWGVSNFNVSDMERLLDVPHGDSCATNQVPYSLSDRAIEHDLLPWCAQHATPLMAYSPLGGASSTLLRDATLSRIGEAHGCSTAAVALAWTIRNGKVIADSKIRQRGARKGERGRALIGTDIGGASGTRCRASAVRPLGKTFERRTICFSQHQRWSKSSQIAGVPFSRLRAA